MEKVEKIDHEDQKLTPEGAYSDEFIKNIVELGPITNIDLLENFDEYLRDDGESQSNFAVKKAMTVEADVVPVPEEVLALFKERYGIDYCLHREVNPSCPSHKKYLEDMFLVHFEEVRLLFMKHHEKPVDGIEIY